MGVSEPRLSYASRLDRQMAEALAKQKELAPDIGEMSKLGLDEVRRAYIAAAALEAGARFLRSDRLIPM